MKKIFLHLVALLMAATALTVSCEKPDNGDGTDTTLASARKVSRIDSYNKSGVTYEYRHDGQHRVSAIISNGDTTHVSYANNAIVLSSSGSTRTYPLNSEGYITAVLLGYVSNPDIDTIAIAYSSGGYLQKMEMERQVHIASEVGSGQPSITYYGSYTETYAWENGNRTSVVENESYPDLPTVRIVDTLLFEYGSVLNKPCSVDLGYLFLSEIAACMPRGWFGKSTANLPSKRTRVGDYVHTFRYETDSEGYPVKIYQQAEYMQSTGGGAETLLYAITYE